MELKFNEIPVDTTLAKEFIEKNEQLLELYNDYDGTVKKNPVLIFNGTQFQKHQSVLSFSHFLDSDQISKMFHDLSSLLKLNAKLFAQLEYHTRKIPKKDTCAQLKLLIQSLQCAPFTESFYASDTAKIFMSFENPLLSFRDVVDKLDAVTRSVKIVNLCKETAFISYLFVKLCHEVGLDYIEIEFQQGSNFPSYSYVKESHGIKGYNSGTLAVITEGSDIDSAIDSVLSVSKQVPWRLRKILVQESIYIHFKDALRWKCNLHKSGSELPQSSVLCSESLSYGGRMFLIDPVVPTEEQPGVVPVEAYRTAKEMISLVQQDRTRYLSLWANGVAEVNEVTHATRAPVLWVNSIADFRGPPQVSEAVFACTYDEEILIKKCNKVAKLCDEAQVWLKMDIESRRDILNNALDKYASADPTNKIFKEIKKSLEDCKVNSFVDVGKDYVCMGISQPRGILGIETSESFFDSINFMSLLQGNAFILYSGAHYHDQPKLDILQQAGVPVLNIGKRHSGNFVVTAIRFYPNTRTRVVWTNSGTIFAN
ncbi:uncharacterized protein LOC124638480 [Helicoverpa zea]|uniref:uncharacterized protein LOC124638480 n=1 Tax=Helicoverpa zea TaxID=7113 RepID=UPI001F57810A|nr:uncharacterized protein LOC124638480 [Helicoverpa zea]